MKLTYGYLYTAAKDDIKIGRWQGIDVYAASDIDLKEGKRHNFYYVIYDNDNKLVGFKNGCWQVFGYVNEDGVVEEIDRVRYEFLNEKMKYKFKNEISNEKVDLKSESENEIIADVKLAMLVDEMLSSARTMTVNSLLEGFNYGLEEAVG